ncbi:alpha/beta fold hydrolase [Methanobacterium ferruginis]|uniref:alpha/beta fold hydrolase n=1 Tax=Methanobacterium ferruginis TaxID=710191 RepID=UPI002573571A|nr:alpha/beta fold hydrolase [Methanobacterium ferruginis]BDZ67890.1 thioesterase [Methanobacterium ferruginis]
MKVVKSKKKLILIVVLVILVITVTAFTYYVSDYYHADTRALMALNSTDSYTVVNTDDSVTFTPTGNRSAIGLIIYPGAKVQTESYSVIGSKLAENGYTTIIAKMPFNLAFFGVNKADRVIEKHTEINTWVIIGHSLGGVFASEYALNHQDKIRGVIYLAAYPSSNVSNVTFKALSIRGSRDGLTLSEDISGNLDKFPKNTTFITIEGGNHYNFGDYGFQAGDNNSTITREEQQKQTVDAIVEFLKTL